MFAIKPFPAQEFIVTRRWTGLRKRLLGISVEEVTFKRRGFEDDGRGAMARLEHVGRVFLHGYHAALDDEGPEVLASDLDTIQHEFSGFAYEGAAMGLTLLDQLSLRKHNRLLTFLHGAGSKHTYMVHVGVGWAIARLPWLRRNFYRAMGHLDPLLRWLAADGMGFSDFYFRSQSFLRSPKRLNRLQGYVRHAYAQGVGRSLWFVTGANTERIASAISLLPSPLHGDLWSGAGLACAMAGGVDRLTVERLKIAAGVFQAPLAQGAAFAAKARQRAGNPMAHTEMVCQILCGFSAVEAAQLTDAMLEDLPEDGELPAYEIWRQRIQSHLSRS
jgi:enediyne biosynthesis protein E3